MGTALHGLGSSSHHRVGPSSPLAWAVVQAGGGEGGECFLPQLESRLLFQSQLPSLLEREA